MQTVKEKQLCAVDYQGTIDRLNNLEIAEKKANPDNFAKIETKYKILRITSKYGMLMSMIAIYDGFYDAFLESSENRVLFLNNQKIKVCIEKKNFFYSKILAENEEGYDSLNENDWIEWHGCEMKIPDGASITLDPNKTWPSIYIKNKDGEIIIKERAWDADYFASPKSIVKKEKSLNSGENEDFNNIKFSVNQPISDFDISIEVPFYTPRIDVLTEVSFNGSKDPIVLTLS